MKLSNRQHTYLAGVLLYGSLFVGVLIAFMHLFGLLSTAVVDVITNYFTLAALWFAGYLAYRQETLRDRGKS